MEVRKEVLGSELEYNCVWFEDIESFVEILDLKVLFIIGSKQDHIGKLFFLAP